MSRALDWPGLMRAGMRGLRLKPAEFWALSPGELLFLLGREKDAAPMARARLEELARAFPDAPATRQETGR
ncbi:MAG: phage tail assembly chaperone [Rubellimicrobium sp.]|nr:phage tail assembly chaperone [Rubellimicrobium sp.]